MRKRNSERGSQMLEFTLIGIPLTFLLFSIANMCLAMLTLHTLQESVEQGARYVVTRGSTCSSGTNSCAATFQQIVRVIANNAPGISPGKLSVTLTSASGTAISCSPASNCLAGTCTPDCATVWPTSTNSDSSPGKDIIITADVALNAPMFMFWTGAGSGSNITSTHFYAYSRQRLMF